MYGKGFLFLVLLVIISPAVLAVDHYTFEHAEEMRLSGRVEWRDYGPDPFNEAIVENKPVFLLLTAPTWCYWCHVYTSDDYVYHPSVYPVINENFIPIYVDADQRQDLTRKYLEGGWPSTTILTPSSERLYGFSGPRPIENMIVNLEQAANYVASSGFVSQISYNYIKTPAVIPSEQQLNALITSYSASLGQLYDSQHGGFGTGQKFPQGRALDFSLDVYELTGNKQWLDLVQNTLQNQYTNVEEIEANYNLFDPVEGGFHRYGTSRDWSPPHYEKMLYDNARLLKAYSHLLQLTDDPLADEVVGKTLSFIEQNWYDSQGGFYSNSDVHGEEEYYGKINRSDTKPRVEKAKYSDWNSDAILTYLYLWDTTHDETYKKMSADSLDFFADKMLTESGAYHYYKDNTAAVRGSILDNSYLLLAFIEGYEILEDVKYLEAAELLAAYSLSELYDWNSGGFFERHSPDLDLYAPGENIDLSKPVPENGIMAYGMIKLYQSTGNLSYLNAGLKTIGLMQSEVPSLDRGYYFVKTALLILEEGVLDDYDAVQVAEVESQELENFWVNKLVRDEGSVLQFQVSEEGLEKLEAPLILLLIIAFAAGILSFISPCSLPIVPASKAKT